jgi:hypothetical protein
MTKRLMLDTNIFNRVVDKQLNVSVFNGCRLFATSVQMEELRRTGDAAQRNELLSVFQNLAPERKIATGVWDDSPWGDAAWSAEDGLYERLTRALTELDRRKRKLRSANLSRDVRIAEAAIRASLTLVSDDCNLRKVVSDIGGAAISSADL